MSGTNNRWTLRLSTEGADQVVRDLRAAATESAAAARAYDTLVKSQPALASGAEKAEQAVRKNTDAMRGMRGELTALNVAQQAAASSMGSFGAALASPTAAIAALTVAASAGTVQIARIGDEYTNTMNKLRAATGSLGAAQAVYGQLVALSQQTGASISESAGAFVRFSVAARAIGATNGEVLQLTRTIQQAGLISGASTQEAAAGVQQLGQALASGALQGDELRSILENMPTLAEAVAQQLGVGVGQLRTMGSEGQLTSDRVFQALLRASEGINKQFTELTPTMGRAFGILGQAMVEFVGKLDQALGLSQAIARAAGAAAAAVGSISQGVTPRTPAEQAEFDVNEATARRARLQAELSSLSGEPGIYATPRRGTISRGLQETAAQTRPRDARLAELREQIDAENGIIQQALERRNQAHNEADDVRQAEEATAAARRAAAQRAAQTTSFNATRDALDKERKARADYAAQVAAIDAGLANGNTDVAGAARLRRLADEALAVSLRERGAAASRAAIDVDRDRVALMREGETLTASVRTEAEKYAETIANLNNLLGAGAITQDTYNRAVAAADPAVKAAAEASTRIERENARTTDRITNFFGDAFARAFEGTGNGFKGLMESFKRAAVSTFASIAAQSIIRPVIAPIVSGLGLGEAGGAGGVSELLGLAQAGRQLSGLFGGVQGIGGSVTGLLQTQLFTPFAGAEALTLGGAVGGIGGGFALGNLLGGLTAGNSKARQQNSQIGSGLGAVAGTIVGGPLGGIVGGALGGGLGGLFGPGKAFSGGDALVSVDEAGLLAVDRYAGKNFEDSEQLLAQAQQQVNALNAAMQAAGLRLSGGADRDGGFSAAIGGGESGNSRNLLDSLDRYGRRTLQASDSRVQGVLDRLAPDTIQKAIDLATQATAVIQMSDALAEAGKLASPFATEINGLVSQFEAAIKAASDLGLETEQLAAAQTRAVQQQFDQALRQASGTTYIDAIMGVRATLDQGAGALLAAGRDPNQLYSAQISSVINELDVAALGKVIEFFTGIDDVAAAFAQARKEQLDAADAQIAAAEASEATANTLRAVLGAGGSIRAYLDSLGATGAGGLSPQDQLVNAQSIFGRDLALSRGGDLDALGRITGSADNLLGAGRGMYASSPEFQALRQMVESSLATLPATRSWEQRTLDTLAQIAIGQQAAVELLGILSADTNADQRITWPEFTSWTVANETQTAQLATALGISNTSLAAIFSQLDANGDGTLAQLEMQSALATAANSRLDNVLATGAGTVDKLTQQTSILEALTALGGLTSYNTQIMSANLQAANQSLALGNRYAAATAYNTALAADRGGGGGIVISGGFADGGIVANGRYDQDSVYAKLAGGEMIVPANDVAANLAAVRSANGGGTDAMARMLDRLAREIAELRAELRAEMRRMVQAGERTADATEETAATNATMARREVIVGRRAA